MGNAGSSGRPNLPPPRPHLHGVPPPYYHQYPPWRPGAAAPPPVPFPTHVERHRAVAVSVGVNVKGHTLRLERDDDGGGHLLAFSFDADAPGSITVYFFAQEADDSVLKGTKENLLKPVTVTFKEGHGQEFRQPSGTGIKLSMFEESELTKVGEDHVFPLALKVEVGVPSNQELGREHDAEDSKSLAKFAVFVKKDSAEYGINIVQQILWVNGTRYVLQEIYGIGNRNTADRNVNEDDSGKECVVCLTEPRDTTVLPCRHMCLCRECAQTLRFQTNKCPMCRQPVESLLEIKVDSTPRHQGGDQ
ncbi:hypothetical protein CFC21_100026 [Triticum aestivum]|uniref:RING-type E3 ubiquitin transferase n=2 Tax=Triticum aestivum TaxID=4565 RepID=A0A9R1M0I3_WHEAT|nr:probable E3 ubiquitin-protein ligase LOG2 [Triticum aestivum]KAF7098273.1 hypothetical protein CFC21_100026 [Triticum aestivum]